MHAFPTVTHLAAASEDAVLKLWEGLGYYSRARNLHAAAKQVAAMGEFPNSYEALRSLKGIGPYTAAAIGSIAFGIAKACVDGNVIRVLSRYHGIVEPIDSTAVIKLVEELAQQALDPKQPGEHNQAMMELGATVCIPKQAKCELCPLSHGCAALRLNQVAAIPWKAKKTKVRDRYFHYVVVFDGSRTIVRRRVAGDIWQGLYEFPLVESGKPLEADEAVNQLGLRHAKIIAEYGPYKHLLSHQRIFGRFIEVRVNTIDASMGTVVRCEELELLALPRLLNRYLEEKLLANVKKV